MSTTAKADSLTYILGRDRVDGQALENRAHQLLGRLADGGLGLLQNLGRLADGGLGLLENLGVGLLVCIGLRAFRRSAGLGLLLAALGIARHGGSAVSSLCGGAGCSPRIAPIPPMT